MRAVRHCLDQIPLRIDIPQLAGCREDKVIWLKAAQKRARAPVALQVEPCHGIAQAGHAGGLGAIGLPRLDPGPFLSYGIQWIAFGILAPIGLGYFVYAEIRARRQESAAAQAAEQTPAAGFGGTILTAWTPTR